MRIAPSIVQERIKTMIPVHVNESESYGIGFAYDTYLKGTPYPHPYSTACFIHPSGDDERVVGVGYSYCHEQDQFVKEVGRKIALTRALEDMGADQPTRTLFWKAYFGRKESS
jgi:hypothetical protein